VMVHPEEPSAKAFIDEIEKKYSASGFWKFWKKAPPVDLGDFKKLALIILSGTVEERRRGKEVFESLSMKLGQPADILSIRMLLNSPEIPIGLGDKEYRFQDGFKILADATAKIRAEAEKIGDSSSPEEVRNVGQSYEQVKDLYRTLERTRASLDGLEAIKALTLSGDPKTVVESWDEGTLKANIKLIYRDNPPKVGQEWMKDQILMDFGIWSRAYPEDVRESYKASIEHALDEWKQLDRVIQANPRLQTDAEVGAADLPNVAMPEILAGFSINTVPDFNPGDLSTFEGAAATPAEALVETPVSGSPAANIDDLFEGLSFPNPDDFLII